MGKLLFIDSDDITGLSEALQCALEKRGVRFTTPETPSLFERYAEIEDEPTIGGCGHYSGGGMGFCGGPRYEIGGCGHYNGGGCGGPRYEIGGCGHYNGGECGYEYPRC